MVATGTACALLLAGAALAAQPAGGTERPPAGKPSPVSPPASTPAPGSGAGEGGAQAAKAAPLDWKSLEAGVLADAVQLTFPERFVKAGESYFDHADEPRWVVFQGVPVPLEGQAPDAHFSMYIARLKWEGRGPQRRIVGLEEPVRVSPAGSANTCGWFDPTGRPRLLFGSTLTAPTDQTPPGFSRDRSRYQWQFPPEMRVVSVWPDSMWSDYDALRRGRGAAETSQTPVTAASRPAEVGAEPKELFERFNGPGYAAECSWSPDGRHVLYTYLDPKTKNPDIWVWDSSTGLHSVLVKEAGYNGGPFFGPTDPATGRPGVICYRSDRRGDNLLQLFVATLRYEDRANPGRITGIGIERALTDNRHVNWAPFFHPSGRFLVYATSEVSHSNYEVFAIELPAAEELERLDGDQWAKRREGLRRTRLTSADGFDGLPVFDRRGEWMMWTSQRGQKLTREQRPSSQLWVARFRGVPAPK